MKDEAVRDGADIAIGLIAVTIGIGIIVIRKVLAQQNADGFKELFGSTLSETELELSRFVFAVGAPFSGACWPTSWVCVGAISLTLTLA